MSDVVTVTHNGETYAMLFRKELKTENGVAFPTSSDMSFQVGVFDRDAGYAVKPHKHPKREIHLTTAAEFLYVQSGKVEMNIYDEEWNVLTTETASAGDFILLLRGGHSFTMLESTRLIEVKQGPYPGATEAKIYRDTL